MITLEPAKLVRIHLGEDDQWEGRPLYEAILDRCLQAQIAGATVYRCIEGFGASSLIHQPHFLARSADAPIVVTIVDRDEKIQQLLAMLDELVDDGLIAISDVEIVQDGSRGTPAPPRDERTH